MKKSIISLLVSASLVFQLIATPIYAYSPDNTSIEQMLKNAVCSQDEFIKNIDKATDGENLQKYTDGIEISTNETAILYGKDDLTPGDNNSSATMHDDVLCIPVRDMADTLGYEVEWNSKEATAYIISEGETTAISTDASQSGDGEIRGVLIDGKTYVSARDIAELADYQLVTGQSEENIKLVDKFQTKRLFAKLRNIDTLCDESLLTAFSEVSDISIKTDGMIFAEFETEEATEKAYDLLKDNALIEFAEPDNLVGINFDSNYTWGTQYCNVANFVSVNPSFSQSTKRVDVAVIDTGLNADDPIFKGRVFYDTSIGSVEDTIGHGTHVAGIIAAFTEYAGSNIKICPYKIEVAEDGSFTATTTANMYTIINKASNHDIINMSLSIEGLSYYPTLKNSLDACTNSILVVSAGNSGEQVIIDSLANYVAGKTNGIVATAIDANSIPAVFSNYAASNPSSYIAAPGVDVRSTYYVDGIDYMYKSGTSQAAPHVTAACAMIAGSTTTTNVNYFKSTLFSKYCTTPAGWNTSYGKGILYFRITSNGNFANTLTWSFDGKKLSINGTGELPDYTDLSTTPWSAYISKITEVTIGDNITGITLEKLGNLPNLKTITVNDAHPEVATSDGVLYSKDFKTLVGSPKAIDCTEYVISEGTTTIGEGAFSGCTNLCSVVIPATVETIEADAFSNSANLSDIYYKGSEEEWNAVTKADGWNFGTGTATFNSTYSITYDYISPAYSGKCGDNAIWKLWTDTGLLCIEGAGALYDFDMTSANGTITGNTAGWSPYKAQIKALEIKSGITVIGENTFRSSVSLSEIVLGDGVKTVKSDAFDYTLNKLTLSKSFEGFEGHPLRHCLNLKKLYIDEEHETMTSVDGIIYTRDGSELIAYPSGKTDEEITLPEGLKKIANYVFCENWYVTTVNFPEGLEEIGDYAFKSSSLYYDMTLPSTLKKIGEGGFEECRKIMTTALPEGFETLGDRAFASCNILRYITIPKTIKTIGSRAFTGCTGMSTIYYTGTQAQWNAIDKASDWNYLQPSIEVIFERGLPPEEHDDHGTCGNSTKWYYWADEQFLYITGSSALSKSTSLEKYKTNIKTVVIEEGITEIPDSFFYGYTAMVSIDIADTVTEVGQWAFAECSALESITIPKNIKILSYSMFENCTSLKNVTLYEGIELFDYYSFYGCKSLEQISIPESVTIIGNYSFASCSALKTVNIPSNVTEISQGMFSGCVSLEEIQLSSEVTAIQSNAFDGCSGLKEVHSADSVTYIDDYAFKGCTSLFNFTLPKNLKSISNLAFKDSSVNSFEVHPESTLLSSEDGVLFSYDKTILIAYPVSRPDSEYTLPNGVTKIAAKAFQKVENLEKVILPETVTEIGNNAFYNALKLSTVEIPGVEFIGEYAFAICHALNSIFLAKVETISENAFYSCTSLSHITIGENVKTIESSAFVGCTGINTILVHAGERSIGNNAFPYSLKNFRFILHTGTADEWSKTAISIKDAIVIHNYVPEQGIALGSCGENATWAMNPFEGKLEISGTGDLYDYTQKSGIPWYQYIGIIETVTVAPGITSIGNYMFYEHTSLKGVNLCESLTKIGDAAFYGCSALQLTKLPDMLKSVGNEAFCNCSSITSLEINSELESIGTDAFYSSNTITAYYKGAIDDWNATDGAPESGLNVCCYFDGTNYPEYFGTHNSIHWQIDTDSYILTIYGKGAVDATLNSQYSTYAAYIKTVSLDENITELSDKAFKGLTALESFTVPGHIKTMGSNVFDGCTALTSADLSATTLTTIPDYTFNNCRNLTKITLPAKYTSIGSYAFSGCSKLSTINLPSSLTSIGAYAFNNCSALKSINIPANVSQIGQSAFTYSGLTSIELPSKLTQIPSSMFSNCSSLTSVNIPATVSSIGATVFNNCYNLESITIPDNVTRLEYGIFINCRNLKSIELPKNLLYIGRYAFQSCSSLTKVTIPDGTTTIDYGAFLNAYNINSIIIPRSMQSFGSMMFSYNPDTSYSNPTVYYKGSESEWSAIANNSQIPTEYVVFSYVTDEPSTEIDWTYDSKSFKLSITQGAMQDWTYETRTNTPWREYSGKIKEIYIGADVTHIGAYAFSDMYSLNKITVDSKNKMYRVTDGILYKTNPYELVFSFIQNRVQNITIPNGVEKVCDGAFTGSTYITKVSMPDSVTHIGKRAFERCSSLSSVSIGANLTSIGSYAFSNCFSLREISYNGSEDKWNLVKKGEKWNQAMSATIKFAEAEATEEHKEISLGYNEKTKLLNISITSSTGDYSGSLIIAFYDGNKLIDVIISSASKPTLNCYVPNGTTTAVAMWIERFGSLKPMCNASEISL